MPSASHAAGEEAGVIKHVAEVSNPAADVAKPLAPVTVVNATDAPAATFLVCGVATGALGVPTVATTVALPRRVVESATTYFTGDALPVNEGNGSNVIVPAALTV